MSKPEAPARTRLSTLALPDGKEGQDARVAPLVEAVDDVNLSGFLLARIAEDEEMALMAADRQGPRWFDEDGIVSSDRAPINAPGNYLEMYAPEGRWMLWDSEGAASLGVHPATSAHIARHDPARVLAECEAKRRIVAYCDSVEVGTYNDQGPAVADDVMALLALPYVDHPDYDETWRP